MNKLILASSSPRRKDILSRFDIDIEIVSSSIEEKIRTNEEPKQVVMSLAFQKALDVTEKFYDNEIVIAADTIVFKDKILGKPRTENEALDMLKLLNGNVHSVITGISIIQAGTNKKVIDFVETKVKFRQLSEEKLRRYIETNEYKDKAGSYAIQGYGSVLVDWIHGSYFNVVGLPISKLDYLLEKHFNFKLF